MKKNKMLIETILVILFTPYLIMVFATLNFNFAEWEPCYRLGWSILSILLFFAFSYLVERENRKKEIDNMLNLQQQVIDHIMETQMQSQAEKHVKQ